MVVDNMKEKNVYSLEVGDVFKRKNGDIILIERVTTSSATVRILNLDGDFKVGKLIEHNVETIEELIPENSGFSLEVFITNIRE